MEISEKFKSIGTFISTLSVVIGVIISVMNFRIAKEKEAESRKIEAAKPFLELRQKLYLEALNNASILASKTYTRTTKSVMQKKRFSELYWGELSLVEESSIEATMVAVARAEGLAGDSSTATQRSAYDLAHAMRRSLIKSWGADTSKIGRVNE